MLGIKPRKRGDGKSSVRDLVRYIAKETKTQVDDDLRALWFVNTMGDDTKAAIHEIQQTIDFCPRVRDGISHYILSWPKSEMPSLEQARECGLHVMNRMGAAENQAVFALHQDTDNFHLHLAICRVDLDGNVVNMGNGWDAKEIQISARELEMKYGWEVQRGGLIDVIDGQIVDTGRKATVGKRAKDYESHTGESCEEGKVRKVCPEIMAQARDWESLHRGLAAHGITLHPRSGGGILELNGVNVKLCRVGRDHTWKKLEARLGPFEASPAVKGGGSSRISAGQGRNWTNSGKSAPGC